MALERFNPQREGQTPPRERIIIYGRAGIGKSRLALMLPENEKWGEILYYASDDSSEWLTSIPPAARARIHVIKPRGDQHLQNFQEFCMRDWKNILGPDKKPLAVQPYAKVGTIVVDTFSTIAFRVIQQIADYGFITREEHFKIGDPEDGGFAIPTRSDYQGLESGCKGFLDSIFDKQRDFNIIFVCHQEAKEISKGLMAGGPAVPGRRMLEDLPASFNTVFRVIKEPVLVPGKSVPVMKPLVLTSNDGYFIAKLREGDVLNEGKFDRVPLDPNPVTFWEQHDARMEGINRSIDNKER